MADETRALYGLVHDDIDDEDGHKDCLTSRITRDVNKLFEEFQRFRVFQQENPYDLVALTTGDVAPENVCCDLTEALKNGLEILSTFVDPRLIKKDTSFHDSLSKKKIKNIFFSV